MSEGRIYLVGAGPGDPALATLRAAELLARADVVVYDRLVSPRLLDLAADGAQLIYVGKAPGDHTLGQDEINKLLVDKARGGATVVRLKGGDPFVFGRGGEEALAAADAGIEFEVVPGVTAGVAAAACAGIPLTHRGLAGQVAFITAHDAAGEGVKHLDFDALARFDGTLVFYMGVANLEPICRGLIGAGLSADTPAAVVQWGGTGRQRTVSAAVDALPQLAAEAAIKPPAVIIIGQVAALRDKLAWFERRPLFGRRIAVTRAAAQSAGMIDALQRLGADVLAAPAIRIAPADDSQPMRDVIAELADFNWVVFTSTNAVDAFFAALADADLDSRALAGCRICTIGSATAERLATFGLRPDAQPTKAVGGEIAAAVAAHGELAGAKILCPRSDIARGELIESLQAAGAEVREVVAYRTVAEEINAEALSDLLARDGLHWLTFASPSAVTNFFDAVAPEHLRSSSARLASIGPVTSRALAELGLAVAAEAKSHSAAGLVDAIVAIETAGGQAS